MLTQSKKTILGFVMLFLLNCKSTTPIYPVENLKRGEVKLRLTSISMMRDLAKNQAVSVIINGKIKSSPPYPADKTYCFIVDVDPDQLSENQILEIAKVKKHIGQTQVFTMYLNKVGEYFEHGSTLVCVFPDLNHIFTTQDLENTVQNLFTRVK